jgi:hypothetical protein
VISADKMFINKDHVKEKVARLNQVRGILSEMMLLTTKTKGVVASFTSSRALT